MENYKQAKRFENFVRLSVLFLFVLVCVAVFSFVKLGKVRKQNEQYDELIAKLQIENKRINQSVEESTSPDYLEKQVREKYGMIKGDETYIEFKG